MLCTLIGSPRMQADACFKKCKFRKYKCRKIQIQIQMPAQWNLVLRNTNSYALQKASKMPLSVAFVINISRGPLQTFYRSRFSSRRERLQNLQSSEDSKQVSPSSSSVVSLFEMISTEYCRVRTVLVCFSTHTSYLSQTPQTCLCKKKLPGVNLYRFNAKNWRFFLQI